MVLKSFSKINLSLNINKKLKNGLHNIQSYFCQIDLFDKIKIKKIKGTKDNIKFKGEFAKYINKKKNTISDTLDILRKQNIISNYYSVLIEKKIPVFAGLGGGTSNAMCLIEYFAKKNINKKLFNIFKEKIGSDLKLFLYRQGFLKKLNNIQNFKKNHKFIFLLIYPNLKSSTKNVYSKVRNFSSNSKKNIFVKNYDKNFFIKFLASANNDLQTIVEKKHPIIKKLIRDIGINKGCYFSRITGSGSVCYGMFASEKSAKVALNKIKLKYPKFWFSVAKTI